MSTAEIKNKERAIDELVLVLRKIFGEPEICAAALEIARKHINEEHANVKIADELSSLTSIKIPIEHSEADTLFLEMLKDLVRDEQALY
ncbi:hypothetical protein [Amphritea balenae]|uniref:Uncharacterized protein n=1 Tax=Amphritea balenae TaxID=452629 RepID=A0A3P1SIW2_9GAMM|nr:hypothetical protein [Amphritea balenae]RRC96977.1 hypothetical protein EHS89_19770 [Amphritea balenae]GGK85179.1 hypothetical protein GCM10007941_39590 [Amphritea balenae]